MNENNAFNLKSLGIMIDEDNDFCRGFGEETNKYNEKYFENEDNEEDYTGEDSELNDKAPEMPQQFYHEVDSFLNRPAPRLGNDDISNNVLKKKKSSKKAKNDLPVPPAEPMFPKINNGKSDTTHIINNVIDKKNVKSKIYNKDSVVKEEKKKGINTNLLKEAFAYTDKLLREAVIEEAKLSEEKVDNSNIVNTRNTKSAPTENVYNNTNNERSLKPSKSEGNSAVNMIRKLKNNKPQQNNKSINNKQNNTKLNYENNTTFSIDNDTEQDLKRNVVNFDELVSNFENKTTFQKLQKELEQSKQSMARSENFLKSLSLEYLNRGL